MNKKILKEMFHCSKWPSIDFGLADVPQQAQKLAGKFSISGVQPKLSVKLDKKQNMLIVVDAGGEYILKPQQTFLRIPENEQCCMDIAQELGIEVPPHCLLSLKDKSLAYVIKRFDRDKRVKIQQEDFVQIIGVNDKYKGSVEQIGRKLKEISSAPGYDVQLFFDRVVLNFIVGNGDAHLKNYAILHKEGGIRLAPAYDIVCSKLVILNEDESAININGKKNHLLRKDFDCLAEYFNVPIKVRYERFEKKFNLMREIVLTSQMNDADQARFLDIIKERLDRLKIVQ
ncbi:MAG: HipA domain-containing protein [Candidatus Omnitrophica bacterium]|nr:HipA domain-containing protein [Candidatus Omnitrophota bacterium]